MLNEIQNQTNKSQEWQNPVPSKNSENLKGRIKELNQKGNKSGKKKKIYLAIGIIFLGSMIAGGYYFRDDVVSFFSSEKQTSVQDPIKVFYDCSGEHPESCDNDCQIDEDCKFTCGCGAINKNEVCQDEGIIYDCVDHYVSCENNKCILGEEKLQNENQIDISDWQTYRNKKFGFEMKYPVDWKEASEEEKEQLTVFASKYDMPVLDRDALGKVSEELVSVDITVLDNLEKKSLNDFSLERMGGEDVILVPRNSFSINGVEVIQAGYNYEKMDLLEVLNMIKISPEELVYIQLIADSSFKDDIDIFNEIIYSFKLFQDTDNDGLSDNDEAKYGCDMNNPDTDGDGYLDGDEVENGYNPMGEGKL
ncbi:MAG: hypothetical protein KAI71_01005 [Candidatus Pacebacteria bacterium]|nr:hypothetical protein [Candidatus Paceibacterota bacterium]